MTQNPAFAAIYATDPDGNFVQVKVDAAGNLQVTPQESAPVSLSQSVPGASNGVAFAPTSIAGAGIAVKNTGTALAAGLVIKNAAGNVYDAKVQNETTTPGWAMLLDAASIPATGTLATGLILDSAICGVDSLGGVASFGPYNPPIACAHGATIVFSTTAPPVMTTVAGSMWGKGRGV